MSRPKLSREVALLYGVTLLVTVGLTWAQGSVGWIRGYLLVIVAATFLYLPIEVLQRKGEDPADLGIHRRDPWKALRLALLVSAVVFVPYLIGFHFWQTNFMERAGPSVEARFDRWPVELEDAPRLTKLRSGEVRLFTVEERAWLAWHLPPGQRFEATAKSDAPIEVVHGHRFAKAKGGEARLRGGSDGRVVLSTAGTSLEVGVRAGGDDLPASRLRLGTALVAADANPYKAKRSYWWILNIILVQLLLVAVPEEVFYRGYLQTRLDSLIGKDRKILGVDCNVLSMVLTSALFALGHFLTIPSPARLAVFFPSLLFGWMRRASGGILAPALFHAACNLLVEFAVRFYI